MTFQVDLEILTQERKEYLANSRLCDTFFGKRTPLWENLGEQAKGTGPPTNQSPSRSTHGLLLENQLLNIPQHTAVYKQDPRGTS